MFKKVLSILAATAFTVTVSSNVQAATITVEKGDTLWDLSRANNTTVKNIKMLNHLTSDLIYPGDMLTIVQPKQYLVKQGDTLWDIAIEHQVSVSQIKEWNQLHTDLIHPELNLVIFEGVKPTSNAVAAKPAQSVTVTAMESTKSASAIQTKKESTSSAPAVQTKKESTSSAPAAQPKKETASAAPVTEKPKENKTAVDTTSESNTEAKVITVEATAYTASCEGCSGITSTGINLKENPDTKVISVDPSVIPLGSKVHVEGYGEAIAGDTGGAIKGNKIDVFIPSKQDAIDFGRKQVKVTILN
ncbi:3D domain-containing protein [Bacillus timonensis]|uniref:3D domain-containing protein n=1 Tax=Bacillus timonensis TaxID=1033734 RepID=UPI000289C279|nr:3D domain-containing protein [Bacillus timonensis]